MASECEMLFDLFGTARPREVWGSPLLPPPGTRQPELIKALLAVSRITCGKVPVCPVSGTEAWK